MSPPLARIHLDGTAAFESNPLTVPPAPLPSDAFRRVLHQTQGQGPCQRGLQINAGRARGDSSSMGSWLSLDRLPAVLLLFDLDKFKSVNDTFGHHVGGADELHRSCPQRQGRSLRPWALIHASIRDVAAKSSSVRAGGWQRSGSRGTGARRAQARQHRFARRRGRDGLRNEGHRMEREPNPRPRGVSRRGSPRRNCSGDPTS
jgi:Diguanylate cyclase, GGDEF domain